MNEAFKVPAVEKETGSDMENVEVMESWRELKEVAPAQADLFVEQIDGFEEMNISEQMAELQILMDDLSQDNEYRFVAEVLAIKFAKLDETHRHQMRMDALNSVT
jgi:hypothetical protein